MIKGSCHCGAVRFSLNKKPDWLTSCNCSICRRLGVLWAHGDSSDITIESDSVATLAYLWGDKSLAFHTCKTCGCTTHWESLGKEQPRRMAVNCHLAEPADIAPFPIRHFDGANSWKFLD